MADLATLPWSRVLDYAPDAMLVADCAGDILFANRRVRRLLGHEPARLPGRSIDMLLPDATDTLCKRLQEGGAARQSMQAVVAGGGMLDVIVNVSVLPFDGHLLLLASILEAPAAAGPTATEAAGRYLQAVIDNITAFVGLFTPDGRALLLNRAILDASELSEQDLKRCYFPDVPAWREDPLERQKVVEAMRLATAGQTARIDITARIGGRQRHLDLMFAPLRGYGERIEMIVGTAVDVTDRAAAEHQQRAAGRMEALGKLAGGIAFDFNNLLAVISDSIELLQDELGDAQRIRPLTETALQAAYRGASLSRSLLSFVRAEGSTPKFTDAGRLIAEVGGLLRRILPANIDLRLHEVPDCWLSRTDPGQLQNALVNLAINARDAMPAGGTLDITVGREQLDAAAAAAFGIAPGWYIRILVADTGCGMSPAVVRHAFQPFFTTRDRASGLGLSTVQGFVRQYGGHVDLASEPGRGTTVRLLLPARAARL